MEYSLRAALERAAAEARAKIKEYPEDAREFALVRTKIQEALLWCALIEEPTLIEDQPTS